MSHLTGLLEDDFLFPKVNNSIGIKKYIMRFRDFQIYAKNLPAFNLNDVWKFEPDFYRQQLNDWSDRGYIQSITGGFYMLADTKVDENYLIMRANRIYEPSYMSKESALAYYLVLPETVLGITSVGSRETK
jgi:predicted transcriptional regulator of viral defense system